MTAWEAHTGSQVAHGWRTLLAETQGAASSNCCQHPAGEVSHHCPHEEDTEKGHVAAQPHMTLGYSPGADEEMKCSS